MTDRRKQLAEERTGGRVIRAAEVRRGDRFRRTDADGYEAADFAGHSLRSGYRTQAVRDGHRLSQIADVTRHRDERSLDGYVGAGRGRKDVATVL
jgi:hypothetical protein